MGLQLRQIEAQNRLANAQETKTIAEANKIAGVDTKGQELQNKCYGSGYLWIRFRIRNSRYRSIYRDWETDRKSVV